MFNWPFFITLLLFVRSTSVAAQDMHFIHLTMNEGLSSDYITDVYQDSTGLYWIATHNGLNIYDGHHVHVLHADPADPHSLPNDEIVSILPDFKGHLWIGTNGGAAKLDLKTWRCIQFKNPENLAALPNDFDNKFFRFGDTVVRQANLKLWLVDEIKNTFSILPLPEPFVNELLTGIHIQGDNAILVSYSRVAIVNLKTGSYNIPSLPSGVAIQHLLLKPYATSNPNEFWITTWGNGLWKLQIDQNKLFPSNDYALNLDRDAIVFDVFEEKRSGLHEAYVSSNKGLTRLSIQDGEILDAQRFSYKNEDIYSFRGEAKRYFRLSDNEVWIASDQGINILLKRNQAVQTEENVRGNSIHFFADTISGRQVHWLCLWDSDGLFLRDAFTGEVQTIKPTGEQKSEWNNVSAIDRATDGTYWVGTLRGVVHARYDGNRWIVLRKYEGMRVNSLALDNDSRVWITTFKGGQFMIDALGQVHLLNDILQHPASSKKEVLDIIGWNVIRRKNGDMVLALDQGVCIVHPNLTYEIYQQKVNTQYGSSLFTQVYCALEDAQQNLWFGSSNGLFEFQSNGIFNHYTTSDGISDMHVGNMCADEDGSLWLLCSTALTKWSKTEFKHFKAANGFPYYRPISGLLLWKNHKNEKMLWVGNDKSPALFNASQALQNEQQHPIRIFLFSVGEKTWRLAQERFQQSFQLPLFHHDENDIHIEFALPTPFANQYVSYVYQLIGVNEHPVLIGSQSKITFSSLPPGEYTFRVWTTDRPEAFDEVTFSISPPYWKQAWFISIVLISIIGIIVFVVRYVFTRNLRERILILEKQQALELERGRISQDMHDELGSGLTKIALLSDLAQSKAKRKEPHEQALADISYISRDMVKGLQEIIWTLKSKNDSLPSLAAYTRESASYFFDKTSIQLIVDFPEVIPDIVITKEQRRNVYLILKESLNNALKHSKASQVTLRLEINKDHILFEVIDNGVGFTDGEVRAFSNGVSGMQERAQQIQAVFRLHHLEKGTCIQIKLYFDSEMVSHNHANSKQNELH